MRSEEVYDLTTLKDEIVEIVRRCVRCRFCFTECPVYEVSDGWLIQGASGITQSLYYGILLDKVDEKLRDILMRCTTCRSCEIICERLMAGVKLVEAIEKGRQLLLESGVNPLHEQQKALESLQVFGNPYGEHPLKRTAWAEGLEIPFIEDYPDLQTIYYVGCTAAYDNRVQKVATAFVEIMRSVGIAFGIMKDEKCCGDPAFVMGEAGLFEVLQDENSRRMKPYAVGELIVTCPHGFNVFRTDYPKEVGEKLTILHHTQFIHNLLKTKKLNFQKKSESSVRVTYHDPCYLGKYSNVYEEPREILRSIPGIEIIEMERIKQKSLCCGGGGGRMWADFDEERRLSELRIEEALATGAELLVTACPFCLVNLEDAVKTMGVEEKILVKDIAEIVADHI